MSALVKVLRNLVSAWINVLGRIVDILASFGAFRLVTDADHVVRGRIAARIRLWGLLHGGCLRPELWLDRHRGWTILSHCISRHDLVLLISGKPRRGDIVRDGHAQVRERVSIVDDFSRLAKAVASHSELIATRHWI